MASTYCAKHEYTHRATESCPFCEHGRPIGDKYRGVDIDRDAGFGTLVVGEKGEDDTTVITDVERFEFERDEDAEPIGIARGHDPNREYSATMEFDVPEDHENLMRQLLWGVPKRERSDFTGVADVEREAGQDRAEGQHREDDMTNVELLSNVAAAERLLDQDPPKEVANWLKQKRFLWNAMRDGA